MSNTDQLNVLWRQHGEKLDIGQFRTFLYELGIELLEADLQTIFKLLDLDNDELVEYKEARVFFNVAKVYDKDKYPTETKKKRRKSTRKVHPL